MESRKIVEINLFTGQNRDADVEDEHADTGKGEDGMNWKRRMRIYTRPCVNRWPVGTWTPQGAQLGSL